MWQSVFTKQAQRDAKKLSAAGLRPKAEQLIEILRENPYMTPPPFEKLLGDLSCAFSRRITIQHRVVYHAHTPQGCFNMSAVGAFIATRFFRQR